MLPNDDDDDYSDDDDTNRYNKTNSLEQLHFPTIRSTTLSSM